MGSLREKQEGSAEHPAGESNVASRVAVLHIKGRPWCTSGVESPLPYRQVGVIGAAHKGHKSWHPPEVQKGLRAASLGIPADPTLGSMSSARFSAHLHRNTDLTIAFKMFFSQGFFQAMQQDRWIPWETGLGVLGGRVRARVHACEKLRATRLGICRGP